MSVEKVVGHLRQVLGTLDLASLRHALDLIDQAERLLAAAIQGTQQPEVRQALGLLIHTKEQLGQIYRQIDQARQLIQQYLANLAGAGTAGQSIPSHLKPTTRGTDTNSATVKPKFTRDEADAIRATLPPQVPKPNPEGKKTHGKWFDGSGAAAHIVSGHDEEAAEAWRRLQAAGLPPAREPASTTHVEMKAAVRAIRAGATHTEVVLNNIPRGPRTFSCDALLPIILPEGYSLTVHGPNYRKTYTGGKKWSN